MTPVRAWVQPQIMEDRFPVFSPKAVSAINKLLRNNKHVKILLTSSHKGNYNHQQWRTIFLNQGISLSNIDKLKDNTHNLSRKEEILRWLHEHQDGNQESIMIIDDDKSLFDLPARLKKSLVSTSPMVGLTEELVP